MKRRSPRNRKKIILGITGSFGSGKTTVANMLSWQGAKIINADSIAHKVIRPGSIIYRKIVSAFGNRILRKNTLINRAKLADIAFNNKNLLKKLNSIVHPEVIRIIKKEIESTSKKVVILDAPLLIEAGLRGVVDKLIVVKINRKKQLKRAQARTSLNKKDIIKRIRTQIPLCNKVRFADFVIDNSGTVEKTKKQVEKIMLRLRSAFRLEALR